MANHLFDNYMGLVLIRHDGDSGAKPYLFECPPHIGLETGDRVVVTGQHGGEKEATVAANSITINRDYDKDILAALRCAAKAGDELKRIRAKLRTERRDYEYPDEEVQEEAEGSIPDEPVQTETEAS